MIINGIGYATTIPVFLLNQIYVSSSIVEAVYALWMVPSVCIQNYKINNYEHIPSEQLTSSKLKGCAD